MFTFSIVPLKGDIFIEILHLIKILNPNISSFPQTGQREISTRKWWCDREDKSSV